MKNELIGISEAIAMLKAGEPVTLTYVKATGKDRGKRTTFKQVMHGFAYSQFKNRQADYAYSKFNEQAPEEDSTGISYSRDGKIPVVDVTNPMAPQQRTLFISHIIKINGKYINH